MQSILVLTDFSDAAFHAARYAGMLSSVFKSKTLTLFHAYQNIPAVINEPVVAAGWEDMHAESLQTMEIWQESIRQFVDPSTNVTFLVDEVELTKCVNAMCDEGQTDLVVMGITGKTNVERIFIGSNTMRVMETIRYPLLVVPPNAADAAPKKVALATDLREVRQKTNIPALFKLLDALDAKLLVVNVDQRERDVSKLMTEITDLHEVLGRYSPEIHYINNTSANPSTIETIDAFVREHQVDIVVSLHERQSALAALFRKSVSKKLAWHSQVPLLMIPV